MANKFLGVPWRIHHSRAVIGTESLRVLHRPVATDDAPRGELRLRVLNSLPATHQNYLFEEMRKSSYQYLRDNRIPTSEITTEELLSEISLKLLGTISLPVEETLCAPPNPAEWSIDPKSPDRDGRVAWLINKIADADAMAHRADLEGKDMGGLRQKGDVAKYSLATTTK